MRILVLEQFAYEYAPHLEHLEDQISYATDLSNIKQQYDVLLAQPDFAATFLQQGGTTQWVQSTWAGVRNLAEALIKTEVATTIPLTGIKGVFSNQIAEYVLTYMLTETRQPEVFRAAQSQSNWQPKLPATLHEKSITIVGTGSITSPADSSTL